MLGVCLNVKHSEPSLNFILKFRSNHVRSQNCRGGGHGGLCWFGQPACFLSPLRNIQAHHEEPQEHRSFHEEGGGQIVG